jgi:acyl-CoA thioesterase
MKTPREIVETMLQQDAFSQLLGMELLKIEQGFCVLRCTVTSQMTNGFGIAHGGITYSLADSALAFASNAHGTHCVSVDTNIAHLKKVKLGDVLTATCTESHRGKRTGVYVVDIQNQEGIRVAYFRGTVFIRSEVW